MVINVTTLLYIAFVLLIIYVLCCPLDKSILMIICIQFFGIMLYLFKPRFDLLKEPFYNPSKLDDDEKFGIHIPEKYDDVIRELKNIEYNVNVNNHDNANSLAKYDLDTTKDNIDDMMTYILDENITDNTADYGIASHSAVLSRRNKDALNIRARYHKDNAKSYFEEELDEAAERQWFDKDQHEYIF